jgi:hypothetical protein
MLPLNLNQTTMVKYNDYHQKTKPDTLKKGEKVIYELIGIKKDPLDPEGIKLTVPFAKGIPNTDRVWDPNREEYIDIAYQTGEGEGGVPVMGDIIFWKGDGGIMVLQGGKSRDQKLFEYLEMCNYNESNPHRDPSKFPIFRRKDYKAEAKKRSEERDIRFLAVKKAKEMNVTMVRQISVYLNFDMDMDADVLREKLEDYADNNPKAFLSLTENKDLAIMDVADEAVRKGILFIDKQGRKITDKGGQTLLTWQIKPDVNPLEEFVAFVKTDAGNEYYTELKTVLKKK